jgi:hypothetical protein
MKQFYLKYLQNIESTIKKNLKLALNYFSNIFFEKRQILEQSNFSSFKKSRTIQLNYS